MKLQFLLIVMVLALVAGCRSGPTGEVVANVTVEPEPIDYSRASSMAVTVDDLGSVWLPIVNRPRNLSTFKTEYKQREAKTRGYHSGWKVTFDKKDRRFSQQISIYSTFGADELFDDAVDNVRSQGYEILDLPTLGDQSLAYVYHQTVPSDTNDYYRMKFTKGDVYQFLYLRVPPGFDGSEELLEYARIAESKLVLQ